MNPLDSKREPAPPPTSHVAHPADVINVARALTSLPILLLPALLPALLPPPNNTFLRFITAAAVWFLLSDMNFILHQHIHYRLATRRSANFLLDIILSLTTGMSACCWRQHHLLRHHRANDNWSRVFAWESRKFTYLGYLSYSLRYSVSLILLPLAEAIWSSLSPSTRNRRFFLYSTIEQLFTLTFVAVLIWLHPWFYGTYYFLTWFFTAAADYETHVGCDEHSDYAFANNSLHPVYNLVRNNFGYHTAHHLYPSAHWTELPALHRVIAPRIPASRITNNPWTGHFTPPLLAHHLNRLLPIRHPASP